MGLTHTHTHTHTLGPLLPSPPVMPDTVGGFDVENDSAGGGSGGGPSFVSVEVGSQAASSRVRARARAHTHTHTHKPQGIAAPLDIQNIDTDMIIPKEFLKTIKRAGLGFAAFAELRYENALQVCAGVCVCACVTLPATRI